MSILIKGMEMPEECSRCPLMSETGYCNGTNELTAEEIKNLWRIVGRPSWCPLVEVPPHGRLIDADALTAHCKEMQSIEWNNKAAPYSWAYAYESFQDDIDNATTVIEAEKEK